MLDIRSELRKIRKYEEISAKDLAKKASVSVNTIQSIENLRTFPNLKFIIKVLDVLGYKLIIVKNNGDINETN